MTADQTYSAGPELLLQAESPVPEAQPCQRCGRPYTEGDVPSNEQYVVLGKCCIVTITLPWLRSQDGILKKAHRLMLGLCWTYSGACLLHTLSCASNQLDSLCS